MRPQHPCIQYGCHTNPTDILIHGQLVIIEQGVAMATTVAQLQAQVDAVTAKLVTLTTDLATAVTDVTAAYARLQASIDANTLDPAALADLGTSVAALDDAVSAADVTVTGVDAAANAEDPATVPV